MDTKRIKQVAKIAHVSEEVVKAVFVAELLRVTRELMKTDRKLCCGIYGDIYPNSHSEYDVCELKMSQEFLDIMEGNINPEILEVI